MLEELSHIVTNVGRRGSIVIAGGSALSALYGAVDGNCDVDIWCDKSEHPRIRQLLVSEGFAMSRISTRYGMNSSPLISHVETYFQLLHDGVCLQYSPSLFRDETIWTYTDTNAREEGQKIIHYTLKNNKCNRLLQFSSSGTKVDLIVGKSDKTPEEVIRGSFDLTSCLVMYSIGGDFKMEFPTFTLANTSLLCPSDNRIVMNHYMHRLVDLSRLPMEDAIKKYVRVRPWFRPMFNRHVSEILDYLESVTDKGGFFSSYFDSYSEYYYSHYFEMNDYDQEFRRTIWIVVYSARHYMIVDALRHVATLPIGFVKTPSF